MNPEIGGLVVLGVGNPLMRDDAIGLLVARRLRRRSLAGVRVFEVGTAGFDLIEMLEPRVPAVFVDAVDGGRPPGSVFWVDPDNLIRDSGRFSLHQVGLADVLSLLALTKNAPPISIIGIQPQEICPGVEVSALLRRRLPEITGRTFEMITELAAQAVIGGL